MAKIYVNTANQNSTIVANNIVTLNKVSWEKIEEVSGRASAKVLNVDRASELNKRKQEYKKNLSQVEYEALLIFFRNLPSWHSLYVSQVADYGMEDYEVYKTYTTAYSHIQRVYSFLKVLKPTSSGEYELYTYGQTDPSDPYYYEYTWNGDWQEYYNACDELDKAILYNKQKSYILKTTTYYQLNTSNEEPPEWKETDDGWTEEMPTEKKKNQALWGRTKYFYYDDTFTRNRPYLIQKAEEGEDEEEIEKNIKISLSSNYAVWTARGLKRNANITLKINYYDISQVIVTVSQGEGVSIYDTEDESVKKIVTPTYAEEMSLSVKIRAFVVKDGETIAEATTTLKKKIVGSTDPVYLGCFEKVPTTYSHDELEDNLVLGDYWLCKSKNGTSSEKDFMFSVAYELIDLNTSTLRSAWQVVTDNTKLANTMADNIAIGGTAKQNGEFETLVVSKNSLLYGSTTIGKDSSDSLIFNGKSTINAESVFTNLATFNGTTNLKGNVYSGSILPNDATKNLGSSLFPWNNVFLKSLKVNNQDLISYWIDPEESGDAFHYWKSIVFYKSSEESGEITASWKLLIIKTAGNVIGIAFGSGGAPRSVIGGDKITFTKPTFKISYDEFSQTQTETYSKDKTYYYKIDPNYFNITINGNSVGGDWTIYEFPDSYYCSTTGEFSYASPWLNAILIGDLTAYSE